MSAARLVERLRTHPAARENLGPDSAGRANGLQCVSFFADGAVRVSYHWGSWSFASVDELEGFLGGTQPPSWQD